MRLRCSRHLVALAVAMGILCIAGCDDETANRSRTEVMLGADEDAGAERSAAKDAGRPNRRRAPRVEHPPIEAWWIPFPAARKRETAQYTLRHYGTAVTTLKPKVIVEHYSVTSTAQAVYDIFAPDVPDVELHELPGLCTHFVVDRDGTIFQLVPLSLVCRHTVGLNDVAIGIEHVGHSDSEVMENSRQLKASIRLTTWLRCRYDIPIADVIGHAESLTSPYHHERVPSLRGQTHSDFQPGTMRRYRRLLARSGCA